MQQYIEDKKHAWYLLLGRYCLPSILFLKIYHIQYFFRNYGKCLMMYTYTTKPGNITKNVTYSWFTTCKKDDEAFNVLFNVDALKLIPESFESMIEGDRNTVIGSRVEQQEWKKLKWRRMERLYLLRPVKFRFCRMLHVSVTWSKATVNTAN